MHSWVAAACKYKQRSQQPLHVERLGVQWPAPAQPPVLLAGVRAHDNMRDMWESVKCVTLLDTWESTTETVNAKHKRAAAVWLVAATPPALFSCSNVPHVCSAPPTMSSDTNGVSGRAVRAPGSLRSSCAVLSPG
eukprot:364935-Chlamydomonas_euryale.AAC.10